jgi:hypothetical protein
MLRVLISLAVLPLAAFAQGAVTPEAIGSRISSVGAKPALAEIYADQTTWHRVIAGIASGETAWIKVSVELHRVSDAGASEQLELAVGEALGHRPLSVLKVAIPAFGIARVCGGPDVDDDRYNSYALSAKVIEKRKRMVRTISDPSLRAMRDKCLGSLEESKLGIARFYGAHR